ncbi:MAG: hypothetical protein ACKVU4_02475 [Phycisphaerales bacterium]
MTRRTRTSARAATILVVIVAASVGFPAVMAAWGALQASGAVVPESATVSAAVDWARLGWTVLTAGLIGALASACAWPAAWAARSLSARWFVLLLVPMLMPSYLAYIGWSELRAPRTPLGNWLMDAGGGEVGANWRPAAAARASAVLGLVLWSWPLATLILSAQVRGIDRGVLEALRLERASAWRRGLTLVAMTRSGLVAGAAAVTLLMLGSAVPMHLAQFETYAIKLWFLLDLTPVERHARVWLAAWPLVVLAAGAGLWIGRRAAGGGEPGDPGLEPVRGHDRAGWVAIVATMVLWLASVGVPLELMRRNLEGPRDLRLFWNTHAQAFAVSGSVAAVVAVLGVVIAAAVWIGLGPWRGGSVARGVTRAAVVVLLVAGLLPGILIGSASAAAWNRTGLNSPAIGLGAVVLAHAARLGFVAALVGAWAWRMESAERREMRALDGGDSFAGWFRGALPTQLGPVLSVGVAVGLLSFHEIEAAVMLQPPGLGSFPLQMLQLLHYNRMGDLSAGVVLVGGCGLAAAALVVVLAGIRRR